MKIFDNIMYIVRDDLKKLYSINSIIDVKEESDIDSLFSAGGTSVLMNTVSVLNNFELICFRAIK